MFSLMSIHHSSRMKLFSCTPYNGGVVRCYKNTSHRRKSSMLTMIGCQEVSSHPRDDNRFFLSRKSKNNKRFIEMNDVITIRSLQSSFFMRCYSSRYNNNKKIKKVEHPRIHARSPKDEERQTKEFQSKFHLPDKEKEQELSRLQVHVQELHKSGQYNKAVVAAEELLYETQQHFAPSSSPSSSSRTNTSTSSSSEQQQQQQQQDHPAIAAAYNNLGLMYKLIGRFDDSYKQYTNALRIYKNTVGIDHASYANVLHNIGNLYRNQIHVDETLRATDRLSLIESAVQHLQEAYKIRNDELGLSHPHTVASKSALGATLATQILHHYKMTTSSTKLPLDKNSGGGDLMKRRFYVSLLPDEISETAWIAAEEHLRTALQTAIDHPRGRSIMNDTTTTRTRTSRGKQQQRQQQQQQHVKSSKQQQLQQQLVTKPSDSSNNSNNNIVTLSAAAAAQNLAIFIKCRATTLPDDDNDYNNNNNNNCTEKNGSNSSSSSNNNNNEQHILTSTSSNKKQEWLQEAYGLYQQIMYVQSKLLPGTNNEQHPDRYATKYSYAELLDAMGNKEMADTVRKEIIDTYDPQNEEEEKEKELTPVITSSTSTLTAK